MAGNGCNSRLAPCMSPNLPGRPMASKSLSPRSKAEQDGSSTRSQPMEAYRIRSSPTPRALVLRLGRRMASHLCLGIRGGLETLPYTPSNWRRILFLPYQVLTGCLGPLGPPTDDTSLLTAAIRCQQVLESWYSTTAT